MRLARHASQDDLDPERRAAVVPAVLPQVIATFGDAGSAHVVVDGIARPDGPVSRDELGRVLAEVADQRGGPVRLEVREPDGSRYADILQPRSCLAEPREEQRAPAVGPLLRGEGFLPGETVLVAVLATTIDAGPDGTASLTEPPAAPRPATDLVLLGSASGTTVRGSLPARGSRRWWRR